MLSHVIFIYITWTAMQGINFEPLVRKNKVTEARIIIIFISNCNRNWSKPFCVDIIHWSQDLIYLILVI